jgi:hypothetical protein
LSSDFCSQGYYSNGGRQAVLEVMTKLVSSANDNWHPSDRLCATDHLSHMHDEASMHDESLRLKKEPSSPISTLAGSTLAGMSSNIKGEGYAENNRIFNVCWR